MKEPDNFAHGQVEIVKCGSGTPTLGCGIKLRYDRKKGASEPVAIRCLDCFLLFCPSCAYGHFNRDRRKK